MKLEIKHFAAYLQYNLNIMRDLPDGTKEICRLYMASCYDQDETTLEFVSPSDGIRRVSTLHELITVKPILKSFDSITYEESCAIISHIFRDSKLTKPSYTDPFPVKRAKGFISFYDQNTMNYYTAVKPGGNDIPVLNMSNSIEDYEIFFKLNIDMFKLIENGLAYDIHSKVGKRLTWVTLSEGKTQFMTGSVIDQVGDTIKLQGENAIGHRYTDLIGVNDKSIKWL